MVDTLLRNKLVGIDRDAYTQGLAQSLSKANVQEIAKMRERIAYFVTSDNSMIILNSMA